MLLIRDADAADAAACQEIYAPYVRDTAISFEVDPPTVSEMAARIGGAQQRHAWLVAVEGSRVIGYSYATSHKPREAYRWAAEVSVYLDPQRRGRGVGRQLYEALFQRLGERGIRTVTAGMTLPNDASVALHAAMGFERVGVWRAVGWKFDRWHDVALCQRFLPHDGGQPAGEGWGETRH